MQINSLTPTLSPATDIGSAGLQADQGKSAQGTGVSTQIDDAVKPSEEGESVSNDDTLAANRQGRGRLVDVKI
jgi:hypothetical protein